MAKQMGRRSRTAAMKCGPGHARRSTPRRGGLGLTLLSTFLRSGEESAERDWQTYDGNNQGVPEPELESVGRTVTAAPRCGPTKDDVKRCAEFRLVGSAVCSEGHRGHARACFQFGSRRAPNIHAGSSRSRVVNVCWNQCARAYLPVTCSDKL